MSYLPKSKIIIKEAQGGDGFVRLSNNELYVGPYIETSGGKFFAGINIRNKGEEIILPKEAAPNFGKGKDFDRYLIIKSDYHQKLLSPNPIIL